MDHVNTELPEDMVREGTGAMQCLTEAIKLLSEKGYTHNLSLAYDYFITEDSETKLFSDEILVLLNQRGNRSFKLIEFPSSIYYSIPSAQGKNS